MGFFSAIKKFFDPESQKGETARDARKAAEAKSVKTTEMPPREAEPEIPAETLKIAVKDDSWPASTHAELAEPARALEEELLSESAEPSAGAEKEGEGRGEELAAPRETEEIAEEAPKKVEPVGIAGEALPPPVEEIVAEETSPVPIQEIIAETVESAPVEAAAPPVEEAGVELSQAWEDEMLVRLRAVEPKLSAWLPIILEAVEGEGDLLWERLGFLLRSLDAPEDEIRTFVDDFRNWLNRMDYHHVDEFRSELQYRLALALDLEDEEDERGRLFLKLSEGLSKTREQFGKRLNSLFASHGELDQDFWDELEELFIMADLGYDTSVEMVKRLKNRAIQEGKTQASEVRELLRVELGEIFHEERRIKAVNRPEVILMIGVNGVGKTTTIAKLAYRERMKGKKVLIVAADTFRAAAIEQLEVWTNRVGADFYAKKAGSDPASVAWEAMEYAKNHDIDTVYIDTAGRLQTKANLMEELGKIRQVLGKKHPGAPHRSILVLDATTGQNALSQAKLFREAAGANELILTKLDGTAKGGVAIAVAMREKMPITYVGLGEKMEDLRPFRGEDYAAALLDEKVA